jgi:drug/metabolite transporter (DMT)-like permease
MTGIALTLVLLSAITHAYWNFLMKGSRDPLAFSWGLLVVAGVVYLPFAAARTMSIGLPPESWYLIGGTVFLHLIYFWSLGRAYAAGDLSVVYPLARGTGPLLVPILAVTLLGERMSTLGAFGVALVVLGIYVVHLRSFSPRAWLRPIQSMGETASRFALLTGLIIAAYSIWDKQAVGVVDPIIYNYGLFAGTALGLTPLMLFWRRGRLLDEWRHRPRAIVLAGLLSPLTYLLILIAYTTSPVSYVVPMREVGIVVGAVLGTVLLRESYGRLRLVGSAVVASGVIALALG